ncbi:MAG: 16S rRNA (cytosine(1402)-N(4))-methyltransferase RsmH [Anaerolineaceae bacterium]|nr:16S rRNA (cytosine(1402)-N(4))-methyltransferase RsmH [Anaerolineaceae bacterium]
MTSGVNNKREDHPPHESVLYQEILKALKPKDHGVYIDATVGAGGHAWGILQASSPNGRLLGFDVDPKALELSKKRLCEFGKRVEIINSSYVHLNSVLVDYGLSNVNGIVLDLGVSSMQIDTPERGFSFLKEAPLDMRMDMSLQSTAADLVNEAPEEELAEIIWLYGEERRSRQIARLICRERPIRTTKELADLIKKLGTKGKQRIHPATRTFQALRIAVNDEMNNIHKVLPIALEALEPGGRLAVISFHSLEDRIVKNFFQRESKDCICPPKQPICTCGHKARFKIITRRPILATEDELNINPRSRSARLRVAEKLYLA